MRVLGSVGEPINPEAWHWYNDHVGSRQCAIVDTFWQTETGSIVVTPFPGAIETKPGSATVPFFGIEPVILDPVSGTELEGNGVEGVLALKNPWPSIARTIYQDHSRYLETYMKVRFLRSRILTFCRFLTKSLSPTPVSSTLVMVPLGMSTVTSGLRAVLTVRHFKLGAKLIPLLTLRSSVR